MPQNMIISNNSGEHSELVATNDKDIQAAVFDKKQNIASNCTVFENNNKNNYQEVNKYGAYSSKRLKRDSAIRAP